MHELLQRIVDRSSIEKKEKFAEYLTKCLKITTDNGNSSHGVHHMVEFKTNLFFESLAKVSNAIPNDKKLLLGVETLKIVLEELGFAVEPEDAFILFHLRALGKFKIKDVKLREQLQGIWPQYKEFTLDEQSFAHAIKTIRRMGLIEYRKGSLTLNQNIVVSFKNESLTRFV